MIAKQQAQSYYLIGQRYLDRWFPAVNEVLRYSPRGVGLRERLLESAATDYAQMAELKSADPLLELERGRTMLRLGRGGGRPG